MTTIKASCPECGDVELNQYDFVLMVCQMRTELSYYAFDCPTCEEEVTKPADDEVISLLMSAGVRAIVFQIPGEALEEHSGPPLDYNDLLDFAIELQRCDYPAKSAGGLFR